MPTALDDLGKMLRKKKKNDLAKQLAADLDKKSLYLEDTRIKSQL
jgi:hypothetical protein